MIGSLLIFACCSAPVLSDSAFFSTVADCAVCADGFAPLAAYKCRDCSDTSLPSAEGLAVAMVVILVSVAAVLSAHLMRTIDSGDDVENGVANGSLEQRCVHVENIVVKVFPLMAVKIVVVVWQIISQVKLYAENVGTVGIVILVWKVRVGLA